MGYTAGTGTKGTDTFNNTPQTVADLQRLNELIAKLGNYRGAMTETARDAITGTSLYAGLVVYNTTSKALEVYDGSVWRLAGGGDRQESFTWSRANVDDTPQYPLLVDDATYTTDSSLASFQRVSGTDPDGVGGVKIALPGTYHISMTMVLAAVTGRSFIQIGADSDYYRQRSSIPAGEDAMTVTQVVRTTTVDQVIPIWFYKHNSSLGTNTGRVMVRRLG